MSSKNRTRARKQQRKQEKQRRQIMYGAIGLGVLAVIAVVLIAFVNLPQEGAVPDGTLERYADLEQSVTAEGLPMLGDPDAPVTMHEYSSFTCSVCMNFHDSSFFSLLEDIEAGSVNVVYVPVAQIQQDVLANRAAFCAMEQGSFWEMHDTLFSWQALYGSAAFDTRRFSPAAETLSLDIGAFLTCLGDSETDDRLIEANNLWETMTTQYGINQATPTLTFNGVPPENGPGALSIAAIRNEINNALTQAGR